MCSIYVAPCQCVSPKVSSAKTVCAGGSDGDCYPCHIPLDDICACVFVSVGSRVKLSLPTTTRSLTLQPNSRLRQQNQNRNAHPTEVTEKKIICRNGCCEWHGGKWKFTPKTAVQNCVSISFQRRRLSSYTIWLTGCQTRRCRHRKINCGNISKSYKPGYKNTPIHFDHIKQNTENIRAY